MEHRVKVSFQGAEFEAEGEAAAVTAALDKFLALLAPPAAGGSPPDFWEPDSEAEEGKPPRTDTKRAKLESIMDDGNEHTAYDLVDRAAQLGVRLRREAADTYLSRGRAEGRFVRIATGLYRKPRSGPRPMETAPPAAVKTAPLPPAPPPAPKPTDRQEWFEEGHPGMQAAREALDEIMADGNEHTPPDVVARARECGKWVTPECVAAVMTKRMKMGEYEAAAPGRVRIASKKTG